LTGRGRASLYAALVGLAAFAWSLRGLGVTPSRLIAGLPRAGSLLGLMLHPDWTFLPKVLIGLRESLQIAALGTFFAAIIALPFGALAARNLSGFAALPFAGKLILNAIRTFPELILAIAFIKALGPGPLAGVIAISLHSVGMLGKLYAERIESVERGSLEALTAAGASPLEIFRHGVVPEVMPDFLSFALYRYDLNVRSASVLGIVGAGGIGTLLDLERNAGNWSAIGLILLGIIVTVGCVDFVSARVRASLT
jgi:phosphonate transport system permease protein